jgi:DnaJ-class molecular chaperone
MPKDYYFILGINPDADLKKIKRAYRQRAKKHHPDVTETDRNPDKFLELQEAYQTLSNAESRRRYDRKRDSGRPSEPDETLRRPEGRRYQQAAYRQPLFAGSGDVFLEIFLNRREASQGGRFPICIPVTAACSHCRGRGWRWVGICPACSGAGIRRYNHQFDLQVPPNVANHAEACLSLAKTGLLGVKLWLRIRVEPQPDLDLW